MIEELGEHVDRDSGVGVTLGVGVPVGVGDEAGAGPISVPSRVRSGPSLVTHSRCRSSSIAMAMALPPSGLARGAGSSFKTPGRARGVAGADAGLLAGDHGGGGLADGQAPAEPSGFGVVVDQDGGAVFVAVQAVQRQVEDVLRAPSGVDGDLDGDPDLRLVRGCPGWRTARP